VQAALLNLWWKLPTWFAAESLLLGLALVSSACASQPPLEAGRTPVLTPSASTDVERGRSEPHARETTPRLDAGSDTARPSDSGADAECGSFECRRFDDSASALAYVLRSNPLVLGVGEAHALAQAAPVASSAQRFSEELLPLLQGRASHLIVELLSPNPKCERETDAVREAQKPVTESQSTNNQNDYVALGQHARALNIEPFVLGPSCEEFDAIARAGTDAVPLMLETIAKVTDRMLRRAVLANQKAGRPRLVLAYGGALHNDIAPDPVRAAWSYGPSIDSFTLGRYVELDLIVREFIKDNEAWRAQAWYGHFDPERYPESSVVLRLTRQSYVLFFPRATQRVQPNPDAHP